MTPSFCRGTQRLADTTPRVERSSMETESDDFLALEAAISTVENQCCCLCSRKSTLSMIWHFERCSSYCCRYSLITVGCFWIFFVFSCCGSVHQQSLLERCYVQGCWWELRVYLSWRVDWWPVWESWVSSLLSVHCQLIWTRLNDCFDFYGFCHVVPDHSGLVGFATVEWNRSVLSSSSTSLSDSRFTAN